MLLDELKDIVKYTLRKSYRDTIKQQIKENSMESVNQITGKASKEILVLRRLNTHVGTFSDYIVFLKAIEFAVEQNKTPIVDRKTCKNDFMPGDESINAWELFFEQPCRMGLDDIDYATMRVEICNSGAGLYPVSLLRCNEIDTINYWRGLAKKYIRLVPELEKRVERERQRLIAGKRVLGISIREGYRKLAETRPGGVWGHPIQAEPLEMIALAKEKMDEWGLDHVFFTCQTTDMVELFTREFGDRAICLDRERESYNALTSESKELGARSFEQARKNESDYITEMKLLSYCNSMICSHNSGSDAAFLMSKGFEHFICIDKGVYT